MLKALSALIAVHECNSIRRASEALHTDATAVSRQIRGLEHEFGTELIERSSRGVKLTDAGRLLVEQAETTLKDLNSVRHRIADLKGLETGEVTIYAAEAAIGGFLAPALAAFCEQFPKVAVNVVVSGADETHNALRTGKADIGVTLFAESRPDIEVKTRIDVQNVVVCSRTHPLASKSECRLSDLLDYSVALAEKSFGSRQSFERALKTAGLSYHPQITTSSLELMKALARADVSVLIIPVIGLGQDAIVKELVCIPIVEPALAKVPIGLATGKHRSPTFAAKRCKQMLEDALLALDSQEGSATVSSGKVIGRGEGVAK